MVVCASGSDDWWKGRRKPDELVLGALERLEHDEQRIEMTMNWTFFLATVLLIQEGCKNRTVPQEVIDEHIAYFEVILVQIEYQEPSLVEFIRTGWPV